MNKFENFPKLIISAFLLFFFAAPATIFAEKKNNCPECHDNQIKRLSSKYNHKPFAKKECLKCHIFHGFSNKSIIDGKIFDICNNCHDIGKELPEDKLHYPLTEDDSCIECHNPHGSENKKLLKFRVKDLCFECHDIEDADLLKSHLNITPENCVECHDPHGSSTGYLLKPNQHPPFADGECDSCHDTDLTRSKLRSKEICLECHDELDTSNGHDKDYLSAKTCIDCHSPHTSNFKKLLINRK